MILKRARCGGLVSFEGWSFLGIARSRIGSKAADNGLKDPSPSDGDSSADVVEAELTTIVSLDWRTSLSSFVSIWATCG